MDKDDLAELLDEVAEAEANKKILPTKFFNQPNLITISSVNKIEEAENYTPYSQTAFSSFQVNLPRPALDVKSLQLLSTNIPQCNANIPNTACVFWYYRLSQYTGMTPTINNLYYVRLLPSFYKQENIYQPELYGYNQTFNNYNSINTQLIKACKNDLAFDNLNRLEFVNDFGISLSGSVPVFQFLPNDVSIAYDSSVNKFKMTGLNTEVAYIRWDDATLYNVGDIVVSPDENAYECLVKNRNLSPDYINIPAWVSGSEYLVNAAVLYQGIYYICVVNVVGANRFIPPSTNTTDWDVFVALIPTWTNGTSYLVGDVVNYLGINYTCIVALTSTIIPPNDPTKWSVLTGFAWKRIYVDIIDEWDADATYSAGLIVSYENILYQADVENTNVVPLGSGDWTAGVNYDNWYTYLITGYEDPNVKLAQGELFAIEWNATTLYQQFDSITYNGEVFIANYQNVNSPPITAPEWDSATTYQKGAYAYLGDNKIYVSLQDNNLNNDPASSPTWWSVVAYLDAWDNAVFPNNAPPVAGLFSLTEKFDMVEIAPDGTLYADFPFGVGGQPFNPEPKRLLNSILGFTWNGKFNPVDFGNLGQSDVATLTSKKFPQLYNRLRPIPQYVVELEGVGIPNSTSTISLTFTADSYANLVYSSILNIYSNVAGGSSVDTQSASSLLAITSMNCGNLGVAFWDNYIENPLTKVNGDIYSITINFTDEYGEPYYLSNNAVATLVFKVSYAQ
jgi:chitodextrinase